MKIGLVLSNSPQISETFLNSFIDIIGKKHTLVIFVGQKSKNTGQQIIQKIYVKLSLLNLIKVPWIITQLIINYKRFRTLRKYQVPTKQLIHDIHIWTSKDLDYLHFGFGNLLLGREYYGLVMGCKTSVSFRGSDINVFPVRHKISYNSALNLVSKVQVNSMELLDKLCLQNSEVSTKSVIIHPGLQRSFVTNNAEMESFMAIRKLNTRPEIISVGRLHWIKGYELALAALKLFKKQGNDFNYTIVGDGTEREKLAYLIRHYELEDNVHLALSLNTTEIRVLLERSNLFIQTSWAEGFSNSTLEAQALGVPAVVTPVSGMSSIVEHRKSGFISEDFTPEGVLKGLEWYNRLTSEELGILSRETSLYIQERFSYDKLKQNWLQFFN